MSMKITFIIISILIVLLLGPFKGFADSVSTAGITTILAFVHFRGTGAVPTIAIGTVGGGSTASIIGYDFSGEITVATGSPLTSGPPYPLCTVTFGTPYAFAPYIILTPQNVNAVNLNQVSSYVYIVKNGNASFTVWWTNGLAPNTTYIWDYSVIQ